jgi:hypothetical protein
MFAISWNLRPASTGPDGPDIAGWPRRYCASAIFAPNPDFGVGEPLRLAPAADNLRKH